MTTRQRKTLGYSAATLAVSLVLVLMLASGFSGTKATQENAQQPNAADQVAAKGLVDTETDAPTAQPEAKGNWNRDYSPYANRKYPTHVYFGDTHHHTANSGDAFMAGDRLGPEDSYRFARGEQVTSSSGVPVKLSRPLDFLVISDHAEGLGVMFEIYKGNPVFMADPTLKRWNEALKAGGDEALKRRMRSSQTRLRANSPRPSPIRRS